MLAVDDARSNNMPLVGWGKDSVLFQDVNGPS